MKPIRRGAASQRRDDLGAHNKLRHLFDIDTPRGYESVRQLVARWHPYAVLLYSRLLDSLPKTVS